MTKRQSGRLQAFSERNQFMLKLAICQTLYIILKSSLFIMQNRQRESSLSKSQMSQFISQSTSNSKQGNNKQSQQKKQRLPIRRVDSFSQDSDSKILENNYKQNLLKNKNQSPFKQINASKMSQHPNKLLESSYDIDWGGQYLNSHVLLQRNPLVLQKQDCSQEEVELVKPSKIVSQCQKQIERTDILPLQKCFSEDITTSNEHKAKEFFEKYQLTLSAAYVMHSLLKHTQQIYPSEEHQQSRLALDYLISLKALLMLINIEKIRRKENIELEQKCGVIGMCKKLIQQLYERDLKKLRVYITDKILTVSQSPQYKVVAKKVIEDEVYTYSIFTLQQVSPAYYQILRNAYEFNIKIFNESKTQLRLRLGFIIFLCWQVDHIFSPQYFPNLFQAYFEHVQEKINQRVVSGPKIQQYIHEADYMTILNHHKVMRKNITTKKSTKARRLTL